MVGGFGEVKTPTEDQIAILMGLKGEIEASVGKEYSNFEAVSVSTQVVAGTNLRFKVKCGDEYVHAQIHQPLPHTGAPPSLMNATGGKTAEDPLK